MVNPADNDPKQRRAPDARIVSLDTLDLSFERRRRLSPYRELLEQLLDSPKDSALMVKNVSARNLIRKHARALGFEVLFAEQEGTLYVKIAGVLNDDEPEIRDRATPQAVVLHALAQTPKTAAEVARMINSDTATCEAVLTRLVESGAVERDDGLGPTAIYRARQKVRRVA